MASASCELEWLTFLLRSLHLPSPNIPVLYCDNKSAIHIASNPVFHERTKHIDIDCHIVRERVSNGVLKLLPVPSRDQLADFLTKALLPKLFQHFLSKLGLFSSAQSPTCGGVMKLSDRKLLEVDLADKG